MLQIMFCFCLFFIGLVQHLSAYELGIITMFKNEGSYLKEWIEYHRLVGVDHFWMFNNGSTDNWEQILKPYIDEGLVEVTYWENRATNNGTLGWWIPTQTAAFNAGLAKASGKAEWVAVIDIDEFLVPMKEKSVVECLQKHFNEASGVFANWRNFGTSKITVPKGAPILCRLTACSLATHSDNAIGKSIVRPDRVIPGSVWHPHHFRLQSGYYVNGDGNKMPYRGEDLPTDGKQHTQFLRINHYVLKDESYFWNSRVAAVRRLHKPDCDNEERLLMEHYRNFSIVRDYTIINIIKKFSDQYNKIWKPYQ